MSAKRMFEHDTITTGVGLRTFVVVGGVMLSGRSPEDLRGDATRGPVVQAGSSGHVVAELIARFGRSEMIRRDARDAISRHSLDASRTDAARLSDHRVGFRETAPRDHRLRPASIGARA